MKVLVAGVVVATLVATLSCVRQLSYLVAKQQYHSLSSKHSTGVKCQGEWTELVDRAEDNIEHNLPSWLRNDGPGEASSRLQGALMLLQSCITPKAATIFQGLAARLVPMSQ